MDELRAAPTTNGEEGGDGGMDGSATSGPAKVSFSFSFDTVASLFSDASVSSFSAASVAAKTAASSLFWALRSAADILE